MKSFFGREPLKNLDAEIDAVIARMHTVGVDSDEYPKLMTYLERLHEIKTNDSHDPVSRDTLVIGAVQLASVLIMVGYEHAHVITSKVANHIKLNGFKL